MSQSLLLQIARNSIIEVFEATHIIDKNELFENYPVLRQSYPSFITLYLGDELRGSYGSISANKTLLEEIMHHAKAAAFEDKRFTPLKTSEFLRCTIELSLLSEPEEIDYTDIDDLREKVRVGTDGLILVLDDKKASFLPQIWSQLKSFDDFLGHLLQEAGLNVEDMRNHPKIYRFQIEKERDEPILS